MPPGTREPWSSSTSSQRSWQPRENMCFPRSYPDTSSALAPRGSCVSDLAFGPINGPGLAFGSRKHTRSCRCVLVRRLGGNASALAHTNRPVRRTGRLKVADTCCARLVTGLSCRLFDGEVGLASALSDFLCGFGGLDPRGPLVASAMTPTMHRSKPRRPGIKDVIAHVDVWRPTAFSRPRNMVT
jgi:hypothetical protein